MKTIELLFLGGLIWKPSPRMTRNPTSQKITRDGVEYPLVVVDVSSHSHPFYTGKTKFVDAAGRVDKFNRKFQGRYGKKKPGEAATTEGAES